MSRKLHIFWRDAGITVRIKPNTQVATVTIVRSFFEVEEKNDIVADDEFALQKCRWRGGLAARPWPAKKREDSVGLKVKEMLVILSAQSMTHCSRRRVRHFNWLDGNDMPDGEAEELWRRSRRVVISSRSLLLGGFPRNSDGSPADCCRQYLSFRQQWRRQSRLDWTADPTIKADGCRLRQFLLSASASAKGS